MGPFGSIVRAVVFVVTVSVVLAVQFIVLLLVRDEVAQGEPVVGGDVVDACPRSPPVMIELIRRAEKGGGELRSDPLVRPARIGGLRPR